MTAFDTAWAITKEYNPGWRHRAKALPTLWNDDLRSIYEKPSPLPTKWHSPHPMGQTMEFVAPHPNDDNFVVKVPRSLWTQALGLHDQMDVWERDFDPRDRHGDEYYGKNLIQELEDLGFPVVSEHVAGEGYLIQPRLDADQPDMGYQYQGRPRLGIADIALEHMIPDRVPNNWGLDQTGNWRMFDIDLGLNEPSDYMPTGGLSLESASYYHPEKLGEKLQQGLDKFGMQLPASRLLNFMSNIDHGRTNMQRFLEAIEPYSDNPNYLTIDGKPVWREGY